MEIGISRFKNIVFLLAAGVLLAGMLSVLSMRSDKAQAQPAGRDTDYFLKIDGIEGGSTDEGHAGEIELDSFAWGKDAPGLNQTSESGAGGAGKVQLQDIHFTKKADKSSPALMLSCANGKHLKEAVLTVRKTGGKNRQQYMVVKLSDVVISSYRVAGQDHGAPTDEFSLNFGKVEFSYSPQKADGSLSAPVEGAWDFQRNSSL